MVLIVRLQFAQVYNITESHTFRINHFLFRLAFVKILANELFYNSVTRKNKQEKDTEQSGKSSHLDLYAYFRMIFLLFIKSTIQRNHFLYELFQGVLQQSVEEGHGTFLSIYHVLMSPSSVNTWILATLIKKVKWQGLNYPLPMR